jgi:excinuclease ABC subunit A
MMEVMTVEDCATCRGSRLQPEALNWKVSEYDIEAFVSLQADEAIAFLEQLPGRFEEEITQEAAISISGMMLKNYRILVELGLHYLPAGRSLLSLSDGEERRVRLASMLSSGLTGLTYVFDEPTTGLHPRDTNHLLMRIRSLCDAGNTVVMVEHDPEVIRNADHVIDLGPGAGIHGGQIVASGTPEMIMRDPDSVTGKYLKKKPDVKPVYSRSSDAGLRLSKARMHNLKGFDLTLPDGGLIAVTGVSGSGKSTLVFDVIYRSWREGRATGCEAIHGFERYMQVVTGGGPISAGTGSSVVATWCGILDPVRRLMASTPEAVGAGFGKNHFSFLNREGQCPACEGKGEIRISMDFLPDLVTVCEQCRGTRYRQEILDVLYKGNSISSILEMSVAEAVHFFAGDKKIEPALLLLLDIGLGYLPLGQETSTLSGGERQRLDLAVDLMTPASGPTLWLFDEPTAGLHPADTEMLLNIFRKLVERGDTLIVTEHDPMVIAAAGFIVELGPEGGNGGGYLLDARGG